MVEVRDKIDFCLNKLDSMLNSSNWNWRVKISIELSKTKDQLIHVINTLMKIIFPCTWYFSYAGTATCPHLPTSSYVRRWYFVSPVSATPESESNLVSAIFIFPVKSTTFSILQSFSPVVLPRLLWSCPATPSLPLSFPSLTFLFLPPANWSFSLKSCLYLHCLLFLCFFIWYPYWSPFGFRVLSLFVSSLRSCCGKLFHFSSLISPFTSFSLSLLSPLVFIYESGLFFTETTLRFLLLWSPLPALFLF